MQPFLARQERFAVVGSTNDVVRDWLAAGTPEVCLAVADEQSKGRGRDGRTWTAPPGAALLLSLGFRPTWLPPERAWRLAAAASLAMAGAAEETARLPGGTIRLKWPNDLVIDAGDDTWRKLGGVLGETAGLGTADPRVVVGIGINAGWPARDFPPDLAAAMTSLRAASPASSAERGAKRGVEREIDRDALLDAFVGRLETGIEDLRGGRFEADAWRARQATTGRTIRLDLPNGAQTQALALDVDPDSGALVIEEAGGGRRRVLSAEVHHVRVAARVANARPANSRVGV